MDKKIILFGVRHPILTLGLGLFLMIALASGMKHVYKDTRADAFLESDNPALVYKNKVKETFGLSDPLIIAIEDTSPQGIYRESTLQLIATLTDEVNALDSVDAERTISLASENNIVGVEGGLDVNPFMDLLKSQGPAAVRSAIKNFPLYDGMLVSKDDSMSIIVVELNDDKLAETTYESILKTTQTATTDSNIKIYVAGEGAVLGYLGHYIDHDASKLNPLAGLIITIMLIIAFRRFLPALLGNIIIAASVLMTIGFMAYCHVPFYVITNAMPVILIGMAVADTIHILSHYYEAQSKHDWTLKQCIEDTMLNMFRPVTLTSLTTIAGFLGLYASSYMPPFEYFGLFTAFGVFIAWLYSAFLLPALIVLFKPKVSKRWIALEKNSKHDFFAGLIAWLGKISTARPAVTVTVFAVLTLIGIVLSTQLRVNENRINTFHPSELIYKADKAINSHLEGTNTIDIVITTNKEEGIFDVDVLKKIEALQVFAETQQHVNGSSSVVDYIKQMHKSLNEGKQAFYAIPDNRDLIAQYFLLYSASADPTDFVEEVDYDYRLANIRLNLDTAEFVATKPIIEALQKYIDSNFNDNKVTASLSGRVNVNYHWIKDLGFSHFMGVIISLLSVCLVSALLFRSFIAGLMATSSVVCSILMVYSAMVIIGIDLGIGTSMFASVAIGLGVDFAIHTLDRMKALAAEKASTEAILTDLYRSTGRALLFNYLAIAFGFGVLISSKVVPLTYFGTIVVLAVTMSFIAAMTLLPAMVILFKPAFIFKKADEVYPETDTSSGLSTTTLGAILVLGVGSIIAGSFYSRPAHADTLPDGLSIAEKINSVDDGKYVSSQLLMTMRDKHGKERQRIADTYRKYFGDEKKTVFFYQSPNNVKGTGFLTFDYSEADKDDDQWLYLPDLRKVRRISASDRGDYFMGTDFSYEDIKQAGHLALSDFNFTTLQEEKMQVDGQEINVIAVQATPKNQEIAAELGYGDTKFWVNPQNWIIVKSEYLDTKFKPLKTLSVSDIRQVNGIWTRHNLLVENHKTGHQSLFKFSNVNYQEEVPDKLFTTNALTKGM